VNCSRGLKKAPTLSAAEKPKKVRSRPTFTLTLAAQLRKIAR
jgi:hypothetical protein